MRPHTQHLQTSKPPLWVLLQIVLWTLPLEIRPPGFVRRFLRFTCVASGEYFPVKIVVEDREAFKDGKHYVVGESPPGAFPSFQVFTVRFTVQEHVTQTEGKGAAGGAPSYKHCSTQLLGS